MSSQIQQIFFNLILNAMDAMPEGGELRISAQAVTDGVEIHFRRQRHRHSCRKRENIFEPFYSTKEGGTGLGLTVSYNIATAHGGTLDLIEGGIRRLFSDYSYRWEINNEIQYPSCGR